VKFEDAQQRGGLVSSSKADHAHNPGVSEAADDDELSKVLIERCQNAPSRWAISRIASSPGSSYQTPAQTTSWPAA